MHTLESEVRKTLRFFVVVVVSLFLSLVDSTWKKEWEPQVSKRLDRGGSVPAAIPPEESSGCGHPAQPEAKFNFPLFSPSKSL